MEDSRGLCATMDRGIHYRRCNLPVVKTDIYIYGEEGWRLSIRRLKSSLTKIATRKQATTDQLYWNCSRVWRPNPLRSPRLPSIKLLQGGGAYLQGERVPVVFTIEYEMLKVKDRIDSIHRVFFFFFLRHVSLWMRGTGIRLYHWTISRWITWPRSFNDIAHLFEIVGAYYSEAVARIDSPHNSSEGITCVHSNVEWLKWMFSLSFLFFFPFFGRMSCLLRMFCFFFHARVFPTLPLSFFANANARDILKTPLLLISSLSNLFIVRLINFWMYNVYVYT